MFLAFQPQELTGGTHNAFGVLAVDWSYRGAGHQGGDAFANQRWCVGHGADDALYAKPPGYAVAAYTRCHADVQRVAGVGLCLTCSFLKGLRLYGPDDDAGALQKRTGDGLGLHAKLHLQTHAGFVKRFHHIQAVFVKTAL